MKDDMKKVKNIVESIQSNGIKIDEVRYYVHDALTGMYLRLHPDTVTIDENCVIVKCRTLTDGKSMLGWGEDRVKEDNSDGNISFGPVS